MISNALRGILNTLVGLGVIEGDLIAPDQQPVECEDSYWLHTDRGGMVEVYPELAAFVEEGEVVARVYNVFGDVLETYKAPEAGV
ncbi:MAG: peptidase M14, partial [Chloroflexota bacterium]